MEKEVPGYLRCVLDGYLSDRWLSYIDRDDRYVKSSMKCGVPQGLVLGPLGLQLALRVIRGYRIVSYEASLLLARLVPFDLLADRLRRSYLRRRALIEWDGFVAPRAMSHIRDDEWRRSLNGKNGSRTFHGMRLGLRSEELSWKG